LLQESCCGPDSHTRECALKCQAGGYGILTTDKKFIKFDAAGNSKITEALKASDRKDHLRVEVSGEVKGDTLEVTSVKLPLVTSGGPCGRRTGSWFPSQGLLFCRFVKASAAIASLRQTWRMIVSVDPR
jgi:hypothetical protein